jgi:anthranilate phosphoribosyltransferase
MTLADVLRRLGSTRAMVVSGMGGLDEISPDGFTFVSSLSEGVVKNTLLDAGEAYGRHFPSSAIAGGDAATNAKLLLSVLRGEDRGAYRAAAVENAAAAILVSGKAKGYAEALALAAESIDSRRALDRLNNMLEAMR